MLRADLLAAPLAEQPPYRLDKAAKQPLLQQELWQLHHWHLQHCAPYQQLVQAQWPHLLQAEQPAALAALPFLTVRLFKQLNLHSVPPEQIFKTLYSSGTSGSVSRIFLDRDSAALQSRILVRIMQHWLGKDRLPMLIIDHPGVIRDRQSFSARGAGIQGLSFMGRQHCYALNDDMSLNWPAIEDFVARFGEGPVLVFGFTFMVWQYLLQALQSSGRQLQLPHAVLLHSGGWKKLQQQAVSNQQFRQQLQHHCAISRVHNFYGMVEQIGAVFVECQHGHLHCPAYSDVLVRRPGSWQLADVGEEGVLQLLSSLPRSYPGFSLLTEDRGTLLGEDDCPCGLMGKYFSVAGRLPQAEARGCSDTFMESRG